jgi:hypothetical protein
VKKAAFLYNIFFILVSLSACKNSSTERLMNIDINGLSFNSSELLIGKNVLKKIEVPLDSVVEFQLKGLHGFKVINFKVFIGASIFVEDSTGLVLLHHEDVFSKDSLGTDTSLVNKQLGIYLETTQLMKKGFYYIWHIKIWDKKQVENYIQTSIKIKII